MIRTIGIAAAGLAVVAAISAGGENLSQRDTAAKTSEASIVTNENGSVTRTFVESNVRTNGSMVTEHRRETRTTLDNAGNVLESSTSEYSQSFTVGDSRAEKPGFSISSHDSAPADSFLGLKFGDEFKSGSGYSENAEEPSLLCAEFKPAKPLEGFDLYIVYVTPKTHKIAKVAAYAKQTVDPGAGWRRHYLVEALEKKYGTWARLCSFTRPIYAFEIGGGRWARVCLAGAAPDYETKISAWDDTVVALAAEEHEMLRIDALKAAKAIRARRVNAAADAF